MELVFAINVYSSNTLSDQLSVMNYVKQGGVLSPVSLAVITNGLLERWQQTLVDCHMGSHWCRW